MKKSIKRYALFTILGLILGSCNGNNNNNNMSSSSVKIDQSSSSVNLEDLNNNHLFYDNFKQISGWEINNAEPKINQGLILSNNDNKEISLVRKHISLVKNKNYKFEFNASGNGIVKIELLNNGKENIINGMNTTYNLANEYNNYSFLFTTLNNYENVYINVIVNGNINLKEIVLDKVNLYEDYEAPMFYGISDAELYIQSKFDYLSNIKVVDNQDGDITHKFEVELPEGIIVDGKIVSFSKPGEYKFIYSCEDKEENKSIVERIVNVYETMPTGHEFIKNGSFDEGLNLWYYDALDGAKAEFDVIEEDGNKVLKTTITALPADDYQPFPRLIYGKLGTQVITDELVIEKDCSYTLSFKIKGDVERTFQIGVGEVLDKQDANGNWTYYFAQEPSTYGWGLANRNITTQWQTYTIDFKMALDYTNLNGCLLFCFGNCGDNPQTGTFYLDDVSLVKK